MKFSHANFARIRLGDFKLGTILQVPWAEMGLKHLTPGRILAALLPAILLLSACAKGGGGPVHDHGGQDGGGGGIFQSSSEQVRAAVDLAVRMSAYEGTLRNPFLMFDAQTPVATYWLGSPLSLFLKPNQKPEYFIAAFDPKNLELRESGDCGAFKDNQHADASVSALQRGARVCLSVSNLRRVPPETLLREVLGLLLHEMVHLNGGDEPNARLMQELFSGFAQAQLTIPPRREVLMREISNLKSEIGFLDALYITKSVLRALVAKDTSDDREEAQSILLQLQKLPFQDDPIRFELLARPKNPLYVDNYINSIAAAFQYVESEFFGKYNLNWRDLPTALKQGPYHNLEGLKRAKEFLEKILQNFMAVQGAASPICIQPEKWPTPLTTSKRCADESQPPVSYMPIGTRQTILNALEDVIIAMGEHKGAFNQDHNLIPWVLKIPFLFQPEQMKAQIQPQHPEAYRHYVNAALALIAAAQTYPKFNRDQKDVNQLFRDLTGDLMRNFRYYADGWGQPKCWAPAADVSALLPAGVAMPAPCSE